jgi:tRNA-dihydrouridine synthase
VPADWKEIAKAVRVRNARAAAGGAGGATRIIGNGDVASMADARDKAAAAGVDGVMVGRAIFHDPWFFNEVAPAPGREERLALLWRHTRLFVETWGDQKSFKILRKFYKVYVAGFPGAAELRARLMEASAVGEVAALLAHEGVPV